jgi:hypothetical protein
MMNIQISSDRAREQPASSKGQGGASNAIGVVHRAHIGIQIYLLITELLFFFGPWDWTVPAPYSLLLFLIAVHISIFIAYFVATKKTERNLRSGVYFWHDIDSIKFLKVAIVVGLILAIPTSLSRSGAIFPNVIGGLDNLGAAYNENFDRLQSGNAFAFVEYLRILLSPLLIGQLGLLIFFWRLLSFGWRASGILLITFSTLVYIAVGVNKGLADLVVLGPILFYLAKVSRGESSRAVLTGRNVFAAAAFVLFLVFFGQTQELRQGGVGINGVFYTGSTLIYADASALPSWVSDQWIIVYQSLSGYLTQGYQALAFSFDTDRAFTWGFGHSFFLTDQATYLFDTSYFENNNLPALIESQYGWSRFFSWHTAYVWLISDLGYVGTVVLVGLFAFLLFISIVRIIVGPDALSVILLQQLVVFFLYLPANNQVFQNGEVLVGSVLVFLLSMRFNHTGFATLMRPTGP